MTSVATHRPLPPGGGAEATAPFGEAIRRLQDAAYRRAVDGPGVAILSPLLRGKLGLRPHTVDLAADALVRDSVHELLTHGWTPRELVSFARRRLDEGAMSYLLDAVAAAAQVTVAAPWHQELADLGAQVWWSVRRPHLAQWASRHARGRAETIHTAVEVLALLCHIPRTEQPLPDAPELVDLVPGTLVQDARIAGKIDNLLTRAAATGFPEEAKACVAKAQELMVRYATVPDLAPSGPVSTATSAAMEQLAKEGPVVVAKTLFAGVRFGTSLGLSFLTDPKRFAESVGEEVAHLLSKLTAALRPALLPLPGRRRQRSLPSPPT